MQYRSPLANVRGLGSAKTGTFHWWMQRVTAVALIPLSFSLIIFLDLSLNASFQETVTWLASPFNTVCILAWIVAVFYHSVLGLQVVIEDYVAVESAKIISIWLVNLVFIFLALASIVAVFRLISIG